MNPGLPLFLYAFQAEDLWLFHSQPQVATKGLVIDHNSYQLKKTKQNKKQLLFLRSLTQFLNLTLIAMIETQPHS